MKTLFVLLTACLAGCAASVPNVSDIDDYRVYIAKIDENVRRADADSFVENEREEIIANINGINDTLGNVETFEELSPEAQESLAQLHISLHAKMVGLEESRTSERICTTQTSINSNIGNRVCRTRGQVMRERTSAHDFLRNRSDAIDTVFRDERFHPNESIVGYERDY